MNNAFDTRLQFQYKILEIPQTKSFNQLNKTQSSNTNVTKKFALSSCYWSFENPITNMSFLRTCNDQLIMATGTFSNITKVFILKDHIPFIDDNNIYELKPSAGTYKVLDVDIHPQFFNISENNGKVITACTDGLLRFWTCDFDQFNDQLCHIYDIGSKKTNRIRILAELNTFVSIDSEGTLKLTDIETNQNLMTMSKNHIELTSLAIHPSHNLIYTGDSLGYGIIWDIRVGKYICDFNNFVDYSESISTSENLPLFNYDFKTSKITNTHKNRITRSGFDTRGILLTTGSDDHFSYIWDLRKQKLIKKIPAHNNRLVHSEFTKDSNILITASSDGIIRFWDWYSLTILNEINTHNSKTTCLAYDQISSAIFTGDLQRKLSIFV